eukprot:gene18418-5904_t
MNDFENLRKQYHGANHDVAHRLAEQTGRCNDLLDEVHHEQDHLDRQLRSMGQTTYTPKGTCIPGTRGITGKGPMHPADTRHVEVSSPPAAQAALQYSSEVEEAKRTRNMRQEISALLGQELKRLRAE